MWSHWLPPCSNVCGERFYIEKGTTEKLLSLCAQIYISSVLENIYLQMYFTKHTLYISQCDNNMYMCNIVNICIYAVSLIHNSVKLWSYLPTVEYSLPTGTYLSTGVHTWTHSLVGYYQLYQSHHYYHLRTKYTYITYITPLSENKFNANRYKAKIWVKYLSR